MSSPRPLVRAFEPPTHLALRGEGAGGCRCGVAPTAAMEAARAADEERRCFQSPPFPAPGQRLSKRGLPSLGGGALQEELQGLGVEPRMAPCARHVRWDSSCPAKQIEERKVLRDEFLRRLPAPELPRSVPRRTRWNFR